MNGAVHRPDVVGMAVESAIGHVLAEQEIDDGMQLCFFRPEVGGIIQRHAGDTNIAVGCGAGRIDTTIGTFIFIQDDLHGCPALFLIRYDPKVLQVEQGIMCGYPFGLVKGPAPVAVGSSCGQELFSPAFRGDPLPEVSSFLAQQVAVHLVLDGYIAFKEPAEELAVVLKNF